MADPMPPDKSQTDKTLIQRKPAIVIAGPTATGKTALAIGVAQRFGGEVINADSIQLYRDLPILTARPTAAEMTAVPHHLYGIQDPWDETSAMAWRTQALTVMEEVWSRGNIPIITGGTGLYLNTVLDGLSPIPDIPNDIRQKWRDWVSEVGAAAAHAYLSQQDPEMALKLRPSDTQRNTRALEVLDATGRSLAYWQIQPPQEPGMRAQSAVLVLSQARDWIVDRCNRRFDLMLGAGAADEVAALVASGVARDAPIFRTLGAQDIAAAQAGEQSWEESIELAKIATRQYAKRQANWFRTQIGIGERLIEQDLETLLLKTCNFLVNFGLTPD